MIARLQGTLLFVRRVARTRLARLVSSRFSAEVQVVAEPGAPPTGRIADAGLRGDVVVYFADAAMRAYQVEQWLPVFHRLAERHPVVFVTRNLETFRHLQGPVGLPLVYVRRLRQLEDVLEGVDPKVCLYVNNSMHNFQALSWRRALHAHLNHGESDKISMASNQAKVYDAVFVAGEAAEVRYRENLIAFDGANLVRVGRPQLDLQFDAALPETSRRTILYAPTWEGDTPAMDYSSLTKYGPRLVRSLLDQSRTRVVYKPHPRVETGSRAMAQAHREIVNMLGAANSSFAGPDRHVVEMTTPILSLFPSCDALVADVSSVALDWLYLRTEAPLWLCDPYDDRARLEHVSPVAASTDVLDSATIAEAGELILQSLDADERKRSREQARRYYFGDLKQGDSMTRFLEAVDELAARRDALLAENRGAVGLDITAGVA